LAVLAMEKVADAPAYDSALSCRGVHIGREDRRAFDARGTDDQRDPQPYFHFR
jgi:hypothetical protein